VALRAATPGTAEPAVTATVAERQLRLAGLVVAAVAGIPSVLGLAPSAWLLDSAELAEQAFGLGVAHPPGEAVAALWGKLWCFLPWGNVALRVGFGQAVAGAVAAWLVFRIACLLVSAADPHPQHQPLSRGAIWICAAMSCLFATAPGLLLSAVRPEVYTLQAALSLGALFAALRSAQSCAEGDPDARGFLLAGFFLGLGVALHPLIAGLCGVGALGLALAACRARATATSKVSFSRLIPWGLGAFAAGASLIVYLPLRTAAAPGLVWGDARDASGLWWLLSAKAFTARTGVVHAHARLADTPFVFMEELGVLSVAAALGGLWLSWRAARGNVTSQREPPGPLPRPSSRRLHLAVWLTAGGAWVAAAIGGLDPTNPDIRGYLLVALAGITLALATGASAFAANRPRIAAALVGMAAVGVAWRLPGSFASASQASAHVAAEINAGLLDELPARAVLLTSDFQTAFLTGYQRTVEGRRPDVAWAHLGFLAGPGYRARLAEREPRFAPLAHVSDQGATQDATPDAISLLAVSSLAAQGPVRVEIDQALPRSWWPHLGAPKGCVWSWQPATSSARKNEDESKSEDVSESCARWLSRHAPAATSDTNAPVRAAGGGEQEAAHSPTLRGFLGWRLYNNARAACAARAPSAGEELVALQSLLPDDEGTAALLKACVR